MPLIRWSQSTDAALNPTDKLTMTPGYEHTSRTQNPKCIPALDTTPKWCQLSRCPPPPSTPAPPAAPASKHSLWRPRGSAAAPGSPPATQPGRQNEDRSGRKGVGAARHGSSTRYCVISTRAYSSSTRNPTASNLSECRNSPTPPAAGKAITNPHCADGEGGCRERVEKGDCHTRNPVNPKTLKIQKTLNITDVDSDREWAFNFYFFWW